MPMKDAVEQVLRAEADGKKRLAQARLRAEAMLAAAETRAKEIAAAADLEAREKVTRLREDARMKSEAERGRVVREAEERVRAAAAGKDALLDRTAREVMESLWE